MARVVKDSDSTRARIISAFLKLYETKRIEKITIGEIAKEAKIYRGTFYYYYEDIYDLLRKIEQQFFEEDMEIVEQVLEGIVSGKIEEMAGAIHQLFESHKEIITLFIVKKPNKALQNKIKGYAKHIVLEKLGIDEASLSIEQKYLMEYTVSAQLGMMTEWIENNQDITPIQIAKIVRMANLNGPLTSIRALAQ